MDPSQVVITEPHQECPIIWIPFNDSYNDRCKITSHCGFEFLWWLMMLNIFSCACWPSVYLLWKNIYLDFLPIFNFIFIFFLFWLCPQHMEIPRPMSNSSCSFSLHHSCSNARFLTQCTKPRIEPMPPQRQYWILNHLCRNGNSVCSFFKRNFFDVVLYDLFIYLGY